MVSAVLIGVSPNHSFSRVIIGNTSSVFI